MKLFYDFLPIALFFVMFKFYGIYPATAVVIGAVIVQLIVTLVKKKKPDPMQLITLAIVVVLGGSTLFFRDEMFIKWKPTAAYWIFASVLLISNGLMKKNLVQKLLGKGFTLPTRIWTILNRFWIVFFTLMGLLNLFVVYYFDTNTWVNFKLFGLLGFTFLFVFVQVLYISRYLPKNE